MYVYILLSNLEGNSLKCTMVVGLWDIFFILMAFLYIDTYQEYNFNSHFGAV